MSAHPESPMSLRPLHEPIAVVGMACRLPGGVATPEDLWTLLMEERAAFSAFPTHRDPHGMAEPPDLIGAVVDIDQFDAHFFGISQKEARVMDPQQRMLLETTAEAFEYAGMPCEPLRNSDTAVFIAQWASDYQDLVEADLKYRRSKHRAPGFETSISSGRIAYRFGFRGPAITLNTACSGSLVAIHQAVSALRLDETSLAVAGGVNLITTRRNLRSVSCSLPSSPTGRPRIFDAAADGMIRGEGCGVVLLKRLADATRDGNRILTLIRAVVVGSDGREAALRHPTVEAQAALLEQGLAKAGVSADQLGYLETHSSGNQVGDIGELETLNAVFNAPAENDAPLILSSVKTNIGHLETAAGMAALVKVILAMRHGVIPRHLHFEHLNPAVALDGARPIRVAGDGPLPWLPIQGRRLAAVSTFGFTSCNAFMVLEAPPVPSVPETVDQAGDAGPILLPLSAKTPAALTTVAGRLHDHLVQHPQLDLVDVAHTLATGRDHYACRRLLAVRRRDDALAVLSHLAAESQDATPRESSGKTLFLFDDFEPEPGSVGTFYRRHAAFRQAVDFCTDQFGDQGKDLLDFLLLESGSGPIDEMLDPTFRRLLCFTLAYADFQLWTSLGAKADAVVGHGQGELPARVAAGGMSPAEACRLLRGDAFGEDLPGALPGGGRPDMGAGAGGAVAMQTFAGEKIQLHLTKNPVDLVKAMAETGYEFCFAWTDEPVQFELQMDPKTADLLVLRSRIGGFQMRESLLDAAARWYVRGGPLNWAAFYGEDRRPVVTLPTYPFERKRFWVDPVADAFAQLPEKKRKTKTKDHLKRVLQTPPDLRPAALTELLRGELAELIGIASPSAEMDHAPLRALGLESLSAMRLGHRIQALLGVTPKPTWLFETPTLTHLAEVLAGMLAGPADQSIQAADEDTAGPFPLTRGQELLWLQYLAKPESAAYHVFARFHLPINIDRRRLRLTFDRLAARHAQLRTVFLDQADLPQQRALEQMPASWFLEVDVTGATPDEVVRLLEEEADHPFDLTAGPLLRVRLYHGAPHQHLMLSVTLHHIISDLWSMDLLVRELNRLYNGGAAGDERGTVSFRRVVEKERAWLESESAQQARDYWLEALAEAPTVLEIPADFARPAVHPQQGAVWTSIPNGEAVAGLNQLARSAGVSTFTVGLAAFQILLNRLARADDFLLGVPMANRDTRGFDQLIGYLIDFVAVRTEFKGNPTLAQMLDRLQARTTASFTHRAYPLALLGERLDLVHDPSRSALFQVALAWNLLPKTAADPGPFEAVEVGQRGADLDLVLMALGTAEAPVFKWQYRTDLFHETTIRRFAEHFESLLQHLTQHLTTPVDRIPLIQAGAVTRVTLRPPAGSIVSVFGERVAESPLAPALSDGVKTLDYQSLDRQSNHLAALLRERGVTTETPVGVCLDRSVELVVAILAVLKAGGMYVPLDVTYPDQRLAFMIADSGVNLILCADSQATRLAGVAESVETLVVDSALIQTPNTFQPVPVDPGQGAYIIYTSGSTGRPKGVLVPHRGVIRLTRESHYAGYGPDLVQALMSPISFDASVGEMWGALLNGGRLELAPPGPIHPDALAAMIVDRGVTQVLLTSVLFRRMVTDHLSVLRGMTHVFSGGETFPAWTLAYLFDGQAQCHFSNAYGPTENTTISTIKLLVPTDQHLARTLIGVDIDHSYSRVCDDHLVELADLCPGELCLGGAGLARGYFGRPDLTAERFVPDPYAATPGARLYKSGDLVRRTTGGDLDILGRMDDQIKLNGFRIEPGEVEAFLCALDGVGEAAVRVLNVAGKCRLTAWLAPATVDVAVIDAALRQSLPGYMVPSALIPIAALPVTSTGKLDYRALPDPELGSGLGYVAPETPLEAHIAEIFGDVMGFERVGRDDNFFHLGGNSLSGARVISKIRKALQLRPELTALFDHPTPAMLARVLTSLAREAGDQGISAVVRGGPLPLSFAQERLWFLDRLDPSSAAYNMPVALKITGALNVEALAAAFQAMVDRHETLRTQFLDTEDGPRQVILESLAFELEHLDLTDLSAEAREAQIQAAVAAEGLRPFDLTRAPQWRVRLIQASPTDWVLLVTMHHILSDGWSMGVFFRELGALYSACIEGRPHPLPPLAVQYADFAVWQRNHLAGPVLQRDLAYWRRQLEDLPTLRMPTDRVRPERQTFQGAALEITIPAAVVHQIKALALEENAGLYMTLLAAFALQMGRYSGQDDVVLGSPTANRRHVELEPLIGFFVNTLVLRTNLAEAGEPLTFRALLQRVKVMALDAQAHQDIPFERLVAELDAGRDTSRNPLVQIMFSLQNAAMEQLRLPGLHVCEPQWEAVRVRFDLEFHLFEKGDDLNGFLVYNTALFDPTRMALLIQHYQNLLEAIVADPDLGVVDLDMMDADERQRLLTAFHQTATPVPLGILPRVFEARATARPQAEALIFEDVRLTYSELDARANQVAWFLLAHEIQLGDVVTVSMVRSPEMVIAALGILKAGAACLPIDPTWPLARRQSMCQMTHSKLVLVASADETACQSLGPTFHLLDAANFPQHRPDLSLTPELGAYINFTSGSTGQPKGILVPHAALVATLASGDWLQFQPDDRVVHTCNVNFDIAVMEIWGALLNGAALVILSDEIALDPRAYVQALQDYRVTGVCTASPLFHQAAAEKSDAFANVRIVAFGGAVADPVIVNRVLQSQPPQRLVNIYGPTEIGIYCTRHDIQRKDPGRGAIPIGTSKPGTRIVLLDAKLQLAPLGVPGELCVQGPTLATAYVGRPDLTAAAFVPDPFSGVPGSRLYKTGDLVRYLPHQEAGGFAMDFVSRLDKQVKIRGQRIEPGEIEAHLAECADVQQAVVMVRDDRPGGPYLAAYLVPGPNAPEPTDLVHFVQAQLAEQLPKYMCPKAFQVLDHLPLTGNGKIHYAKLPEPQWGTSETAHVAPRNPVEVQLAAIWCEVLNLDQVGVMDSFFDLGGHSLLATRVMSKIRTRLNINPPLKMIFDFPTPAALALQLQGLTATVNDAITPQTGAGSMAPSFAQERLWFLDRLNENNAFYNMPMALHLSGDLNQDALQRAFETIIARHQTLRTSFRGDGDGVRAHVAETVAWDLSRRDLGDDPDRDRALKAIARAEALNVFDLTRAPLIRVVLVRLAAREYALLVTMHHIISDGWSVGLFNRELTELYTAFSLGKPSPLPPLAVQYGDFAAWQRRRLTGQVFDTQMDYWRRQLRDMPNLDFPSDFPRPTRPSYRGGIHHLHLDPTLTSRLRDLAAEAGASLFMVLQTAFAVLSARYTGHEDVAFGSPIANRNREEIEPMIGFFVNTLVMRTDLSANPSGREALQRIRRTALDAFAHQDIPFEKLVEELAPERDTARNPLVQIMFALQNAPLEMLELPNLKLTLMEFAEITVRFDMEIHLWERGDHLGGYLLYSTDLFAAETIARLDRHFAQLLAGLAATPDRAVFELEMMSEGERSQLLTACNQTRVPYPETVIHQWVASHAAAHPDHIAVIYDGTELTYGALNARANQLAHHLADLGVVPEAVVALSMPRSPELIIGLLGILKAGAVYLPIDPVWPESRRRLMLQDTGAAVILIDEQEETPPTAQFPTALCLSQTRRRPTHNPEVAVCLEHGAYINYTSGSTGTPKGTVIPHRGVVRMLVNTNFIQLGPSDRMIHMSNISFDAATFEIWGALLHGGQLVILPKEVALDPKRYAAALQEHRITTLLLTTSMFNQIVDVAPDAFAHVKQVLFGGEAADAGRVRTLLEGKPPQRLLNAYGPTEGTTIASWREVIPADLTGAVIPIGSPLSNTRIYVVDRRLQPVPVGIPGELCIAGDGLARGYLNRPDLTAAAFVPDPYGDQPGARLYKTGDRVHRTAQVAPHPYPIEFLGRLDHQIKLRGFRIELGEIEARIRAFPAVKDVTVMVREDNPGDQRLAAYLVLDPDLNQEELEALTRGQVSGWTELFDDHVYGQTAEVVDPLFNFVGWDSSYDGSAIPQPQMRVWADDIIDQVLQLKPSSVLELGCGSGMLLFAIAPHVARYTGFDISQATLDYVARHMADHGQTYAHVDLHKRAADQLDDVPDNSRDCIIISSVIQYFPSLDYLLDVLQAALRIIRPGGFIFLADLRNHRLERAFHTSMAVFRAEPGATTREIKSRVARETAREKEFMVDPDVFDHLKRQNPKLGAVRIRLQRGLEDNEMNMFRYTAVLHVGQGPEPTPPDEIHAWQGMDDLEDFLSGRQPGRLQISGIPNARNIAQVHEDQLIHDVDGPVVLRRVIAAARARKARAVTPDQVRDLAARFGYRTEVTYSPNRHDHLELYLAPESTLHPEDILHFPYPQSPERPLERYANHPALAKLTPGLVAGLKGELAEKLPDYMTPSAYVVLDALPLSPTGKLDRKALPAPDSRAVDAASYQAPRGPLEAQLVEIWCDVLKLERIGVRDNFFDLGGHSLLATRVMSKIRNRLNIDPPLKLIFDFPTPESLAFQLQDLTADERDTITSQTTTGFMAPSFAQERLWFLDRLNENNAFYNMAMVLRLSGDLDQDALKRTFETMIARHQTLRTSFHGDGDGVRAHVAQEVSWDLNHLDLSGDANSAETLKAVARAEAAKVFDLTQAPLTRVVLVRLAAREFALMVTMHHIISDGWSVGVFNRELTSLYTAFSQGNPSPLPPLAVQYGDFAAWQRRRLTGQVFEAQMDYWRRQLRDMPNLDFPSDFARPTQPSYHGGIHQLYLEPALTSRLRDLAAEAGASLFMVLQTAFAVLSARYTGREDVAFGSPIANRNREEIEPMIGFFVNTLVMRTDLSANPSGRETLQRIRQTAVDAFAHQDIPFEKLVEELAPERDTARNPLIQIMFALQNAPFEMLELPNLKLSLMELQDITVRFDMEIHLWERGDHLGGYLLYSTDLFAAETIARLDRHFTQLLAGLVATPDRAVFELEMMSERERVQLLTACNMTRTTYPETPVHQWVAEHASAHPGRTAVIFEDTELTYGELNACANQLAHHLAELGVGPESIVALSMPRSPELIIGLLGILKAGAVYLPIDPAWPESRRRMMLQDAGAAVILIDERDQTPPPAPSATALRLSQTESRPTHNPDVVVGLDHGAYVNYTSGSTGTPKGIVIPHRGVVRLLVNTNFVQLSPTDRLIHMSNISFDAATFEIWGALMHGGVMVILPKDKALDPKRYAAALRQHHITTVFLTTALFNQIVDVVPHAFAQVKQVLFGGEAVDPGRVRTLLEGKPPQRLLHVYGPTESTTYASWREVIPADLSGRTIPIGSPLGNTRIYVLDRRLQPVPAGIPGELCIAGDGLARGYLNRPDLTAAAFVPDPYSDQPGARLYKTGDRVHRTAQMEPHPHPIEFLGRLDHQIKLRGFRIELGEIEARVRAFPAVKDAAVMVREDNPGDQRLAAYLVLDPDLSEDELEALTRGQVSGWTELFDDHVYGRETQVADPLFNIVGWNSSYDGSAIPEPQMRIWADDIIGQVLQLQPKSVLELGCGTGMLLFAIAPHVAHYTGWDISQTSLDYVTRQMEDHGETYARVDLHKRAAHQLDDVPDNSRDCIIISSVIQYFPSLDYLLDVLQGALRVIRPGGFILLADLRNHRLERAFHTSMEVFRAEPGATTREVKSRVARETAREKEFLVDPDVFDHLKRQNPKLGAVRIRLQRGLDDNEMNMFRYTAVLHVGQGPVATPPDEIYDWKGLDNLDTFLSRRQPGRLQISQIPNARNIAQVHEDQLIHDVDGPAVLRRVIAAAQALKARAVTPDQVRDLAVRHGYRTEVTYSPNRHDHLELYLAPEAELKPEAILHFPYPESPERPLERYANHPALAKLTPGLVAGLKVDLADQLPDYMTPGAFVVLDALPLSPTGKLDRKALPAPDTRAVDAAGYLEPRGPIEAQLVEIWRDVLKLERIGVRDNFFDLGGHSLLATRVSSRISQTWSIEAPVRFIFDTPTIEGLAETIQAAAGGLPITPPVTPVAKDGPLPLSFTQERLWFMAQMEPDSPMYNMPTILRLRGALNTEALSAALTQMWHRHQVLRMRFKRDAGVAYQHIQPAQPFHLEIQHLPEAQIEAVATAQMLEAFDLEGGDLFRVRLYQVGADDHLLILILHHAIYDGWSMGLFHRELNVLYSAFAQGLPSPLTEPELQYADFAVWQRQWRSGEVLDTQRLWWRTQLADVPTLLELPTDRPRPPMQSYRGGIHRFQWDRETSDRIKRLCRETGASPFMVLLALYKLLLHRLSGQTTVVVGSPIAGRNRKELEEVLGFFVNMLALRTDLDDATLSFHELVARVKQTCLDAFAHQDLPFEQVVEAVQPQRNLSHAPIFQVVFAVINLDLNDIQLGDLDVSMPELQKRHEDNDLSLTFMERDRVFHGWFEYNADLFDAATVSRWCDHLNVLLRSVLAYQGRPLMRLSLLEEKDRRNLLGHNPPAAVEHPRTVVESFRGWATRTPNASAVRLNQTTLTYAQLDQSSDELTARLQMRGVRPGDLIGVCLEKGMPVPVAFLAVLKAGAAYVPLDPQFPDERLAWLLRDTGARLVITTDTVSKRLNALAEVETLCLDHAMTAERPNIQSTPGEADAYVIYTSGSTGRPKGVAVSANALAGYCRDIGRIYNLQPGDGVLHISALNFDVSIEELAATLTHGATLVLPDRNLLTASDFTCLVNRDGVTVAALTPAYWRLFLDGADQPLPGLRLLSLGGDVLSPELAARAKQGPMEGVQLLNVYGPTEATIGATAHALRWDQTFPCGRVPIGRPLADTTAYILDQHGLQVPVGVPGQLYLGGARLASRYLNQPALTAERFTPDPFSDKPGARCYASGDRARYLADGAIDFLGRLDAQVKVRGLRIEPGEIEAHLLQLPGIRQAAAAVTGSDTDAVLTAWYLAEDLGLEEAEVRRHLAAHLPKYMVPTHLIEVDAMPLTPAGKIDRHQLPRPQSVQASEPVAPRTDEERRMARLWCQVLDLETVGIHDNFFQLGGHSLAAVRLITLVNTTYAVRLPVAILFQHPTVAALCIHLGQSSPGSQHPCLAPFQTRGEGPAFFLIPGGGGDVFYLRELAQCLGRRQRCYGLQAVGLDVVPQAFADVMEAADAYLEAVRQVQPKGPYQLVGHSSGGVIAFEMCRRLMAAGQVVKPLLLLDAPAPQFLAQIETQMDETQILAAFAQESAAAVGATTALSPGNFKAGDETHNHKILTAELKRLGRWTADADENQLRDRLAAFAKPIATGYRAEPLDIQAVLYRALDRGEVAEGVVAQLFQDPTMGWDRWLSQVQVEEAAGDHMSMLRSPAVEALAQNMIK